jgi:hypothetical protein
LDDFGKVLEVLREATSLDHTREKGLVAEAMAYIFSADVPT